MEGILAKLKQTGQHELLKHYESLNEDQKKLLLEDLQKFNFDDVKELYDLSQKEQTAEDKVTPFEEIFCVKDLDVLGREGLRKKGIDMMGRGEGAMILLAGGQGTRLGFNKPKGCFRVGLSSKKSLFELQADRIQRMRNIVASETSQDLTSIHIPWYIMTSLATDADTKSFFQENNFFGLPEADIVFFSQEYLPSLTPQGQVIMELPTACAKNPNGNGGIYKALVRSGTLKNMNERGVKYVQVYAVGNILIRIADPLWFGHMVEADIDCSNKVCRKRDAHEKVGVMCRRDGKPSVIEYSEITKEMAEMKNDKDELVYGCGNIAIHGFSVEFLNRVCSQTLPIHVAKKRIPCYRSEDEDQRVDGIKLELFIFDTFCFAKKMTAFEALREDEFSPVKNKTDKPKDNANTAREHFCNFCTRHAEMAGFSTPSNRVVEIDMRQWYAGFESPPDNYEDAITVLDLNDIANESSSAPKGACDGCVIL